MNRKKYIFIVMALVVIIGGVGLVKNIRGKGVDSSIAASQKDLGIPVQLVSLSRGDLVEDISYIGTIGAKKSATLSPTIGGQIVQIYVEEGSMVQAGDLIAKIDDSQLNASYITAQKKLDTLRINHNYLNAEVGNFYSSNPLVKKQDTLRSNYEYIKGESDKFKKLYDEGAVAQATYEKIKQEADTVYLQLAELEATTADAYSKLSHERNMVGSQIDEVSASINEMEIKKADTLIRAPIQGLVKKIYYQQGDLAAMGRPFADIDNNEELLVEVNMTESDINRIKLGDKTIVKIEGLASEITTSVSKIIPNVNPNTRIGIVEIGPIRPEEGLALLSGNSAGVRIITNKAEDKLIIPKSAIKSLKDENMVYLYKDGIVEERKISLGLTVGEDVEVLEGLEEGDSIAIKNLSKLYDGAEVYVFKGVDGE